MSPQKRRRRGRVVGAALLLAVACVAALMYIKGHHRDAAASPTPHTTANHAPAAISTQDITYLEQALDSGTVSGQRKALATSLQSSLTEPMFPATIKGKRTTVSIDARSFKSDLDDSNVASVHATISNGQGSYVLRLIREQGKWLLTYTTEVK